MHPAPVLSNPTWRALVTRQRHLAVGDDSARRFDPEILPFAALEEPSVAAAEALERIVTPGERLWLFVEGDPAAPLPLDRSVWQQSRSVPGYQMVCDAPPPALREVQQPGSVALDPLCDLSDILALKAIAFPGFFGPRAPQMGRFRGIRVDGELVAMAGERFSFDAEDGRGYREVSAVCTHPAHVGRGYAQRLTHEATLAIVADGDIPFLHVAGSNQRAQAIYTRLGFTMHAAVAFVEFTRLG